MRYVPPFRVPPTMDDLRKKLKPFAILHNQKPPSHLNVNGVIAIPFLCVGVQYLIQDGNGKYTLFVSIRQAVDWLTHPDSTDWLEDNTYFEFEPIPMLYELFAEVKTEHITRNDRDNVPDGWVRTYDSLDTPLNPPTINERLRTCSLLTNSLRVKEWERWNGPIKMEGKINYETPLTILRAYGTLEESP